MFDVIPSIRKYGSFNLHEFYEHNSFYENNMLVNYSNKNVIYIGYIGVHNNEHLFKFGKTNNIFERDYRKHKYKYDKFDVIYIIECDNKDYVEKRFKDELLVKNIYRNLNIKGRNDKELFTITNKISIDDIKNMLKLLVEKFKMNKDCMIAEYEYLLEKEKTNQLRMQIDYKKLLN